MTRRASRQETVKSDSSSAAPAKCLSPPNVLKTKVRPMPEVKLDDLISAAEAEVALQTTHYPKMAYSQIAELEEALAKAVAEPEGMSAQLNRIVVIAHDLKGDGQSFGFDLITRFADSLCKYIETVEALGDKEYTIVEAHIASIRSVVAKKVKGDGGAVGAKLLAALDKLIAKLSA